MLEVDLCMHLQNPICFAFEVPPLHGCSLWLLLLPCSINSSFGVTGESFCSSLLDAKPAELMWQLTHYAQTSRAPQCKATGAALRSLVP